jgi:hypothetical protein
MTMAASGCGLGIDWKNYREHHALDDAKLLREFYIKFFNVQ